MAQDRDEFEALVRHSRLLGSDENLVLHGGGNTSIKRTEIDHAGRRVRVMRVKGSGGDLRSIGPDGFPGVRLDDLLPLRSKKDMTDAEMVAYLARCLTDPDARRPSIETLLHGFLPDAAIMHSHADAILALTNNPSPERHIRAALGDGFVIVPYRRPGFLLSKMVAAAREAHPDAYRAHIRAVRAAKRYLAGRRRKTRPAKATGDAAAFAPLLRGLLATPKRMVLRLDRSPEVLAFANGPDAAARCRIGPATPDHLLHTKRLPCFVPTPEDAALAIRAWSRSYEGWVKRWNREGHAVDDTPALPSGVLRGGLGLSRLRKRCGW